MTFRNMGLNIVRANVKLPSFSIAVKLQCKWYLIVTQKSNQATLSMGCKENKFWELHFG